MRRQRNTQKMKAQGKNPPDQTNEEEIGSLTEKVGMNILWKLQKWWQQDLLAIGLL